MTPKSYSSFQTLPRNRDAWEAVNNLNTIIGSRIESPPPPLSPLTPLSQLSEIGIVSPPLPILSIMSASEQRVNSTPPNLPADALADTAVNIKSTYDISHPHNTQFVSPRNRERNVHWTENQRSFAKHAAIPKSVAELRTLVSGELLLLYM